MSRRTVLIESPFSGGKPEYVEYAKRAMRHSLDQGEAPFLSHLLYTQVYDDSNKKQRAVGMAAGWEWGKVADRIIVYADYGITQGMADGINHFSKFAESSTFEPNISFRLIGKN